MSKRQESTRSVKIGDAKPTSKAPNSAPAPSKSKPSMRKPVSKGKSKPSKKAAGTPQTDSKLLAAKCKELHQLQEVLAANIQSQAALVQDIATTDAAEAEKMLAQLANVDAAILKKLNKSNDQGQLSETCIRSIFRELASGVGATLQRRRVAFLGPTHSYSHLATLQRFGQSEELVPVRTIASVFDEVTSGPCDFGVVPIEHSTDGRIVDTLDMFTKTSVKICGDIPFPIHHNLLGIGRRDEIVEVCSKPQAISQCREWLADHLPKAKITSTSSTTTAAQRAAKDRKVAAVASYQAGVEYGLKVLAKNIEDNKDNVTRFAVIGLEPAERTGDDKTALMFELSHEPGALADAMVIFKRNRLNLTWIESFPKPKSPNEYLFFVELVGYQTDLRVRKALAALEKKTVRLEVLGSYPQAKR